MPAAPAPPPGHPAAAARPHFRLIATVIKPGGNAGFSIELIADERLDGPERAEPVETLMLALRKAHEALGFVGEGEQPFAELDRHDRVACAVQNENWHR